AADPRGRGPVAVGRRDHPGGAAMTEREPIDVVGMLLRKWRTLAVTAIVGTGAGLTYGLLAPEWFQATLTVVPSQRTPDAAAAMGLKLPAGGGFGGQSTDVQRIHAVLTSTSVADEVIAKFDLQDRYGEPHIEHARAKLWEHCGTSVDLKAGVVTLACEDKDPE